MQALSITNLKSSKNKLFPLACGPINMVKSPSLTSTDFIGPKFSTFNFVMTFFFYLILLVFLIDQVCVFSSLGIFPLIGDDERNLQGAPILNYDIFQTSYMPYVLRHHCHIKGYGRRANENISVFYHQTFMFKYCMAKTLAHPYWNVCPRLSSG